MSSVSESPETVKREPWSCKYPAESLYKDLYWPEYLLIHIKSRITLENKVSSSQCNTVAVKGNVSVSCTIEDKKNHIIAKAYLQLEPLHKGNEDEKHY